MPFYKIARVTLHPLQNQGKDQAEKLFCYHNSATTACKKIVENFTRRVSSLDMNDPVDFLSAVAIPNNYISPGNRYFLCQPAEY
ncbi:MAG: hypothetical protein H7Y86_19920 [Rhizobacter sp.]|nr:hypothetical protein [Ferruginibacter sp.]